MGTGVAALSVFHPIVTGLHQTHVVGMLNEFATEDDVIICAAGSLPGDFAACGVQANEGLSSGIRVISAWV